MCHGEACASLPGPKSRFIRLGRPSTPLIVLLCPPCIRKLSLLFDRCKATPSIPTMEAKTGPALGEKQFHDGSPDPADRESLAQGTNTLHKSLKGRHMQMIAM